MCNAGGVLLDLFRALSEMFARKKVPGSFEGNEEVASNSNCPRRGEEVTEKARTCFNNRKLKLNVVVAVAVAANSSKCRYNAHALSCIDDVN